MDKNKESFKNSITFLATMKSLVLVVVAAVIAVASPGRLHKRPLMEGHTWKMPKSLGEESSTVHMNELENFNELANTFIDNSVVE